MSGRDTRSLSPSQQAALRERAVQAVLGGVRKIDVARTFGVHPNAVGRWMRLYHEGGWDAIAERPRGRVPGEHLAVPVDRHEELIGLIRGFTPEQLGLSGQLWTRARVAALIEQRTGVRLAERTTGTYLRLWGFSPQKPIRKALERDPVKVARWVREDYPAIRARAKQENAVVLWLDEMGVRSDTAAQRTWAPVGQTPTVVVPGARFGVNQISAISNTGMLRFSLFEGNCTGAVVLAFLRRLVGELKDRKVHLVLDGHPAHRAALVRDWVDARPKRIELHFLPGYSPHLNPVELLNHDVKANTVGRRLPRDKQELKAVVRSYLHRRQRQPHVVASFFDHYDVRYAAV